MILIDLSTLTVSRSCCDSLMFMVVVTIGGKFIFECLVSTNSVDVGRDLLFPSLDA